jgi:hypothetical protein
MSSSFLAVGFSPIFSSEDGNYRFTYISNRDLWSRGRLLRSRSFERPDLRAGARVFALTPKGLACSHPDFVSLIAGAKTASPV